MSMIPLPNTRTLESFESLQRYTRASGYKLKEPCSHFLSIFFNYLPEPPHHWRFWGAVLKHRYTYMKKTGQENQLIKHITMKFPLHGSMKDSLLEQPTTNKNFIIK